MYIPVRPCFESVLFAFYVFSLTGSHQYKYQPNIPPCIFSLMFFVFILIKWVYYCAVLTHGR